MYCVRACDSLYSLESTGAGAKHRQNERAPERGDVGAGLVPVTLYSYS